MCYLQGFKKPGFFKKNPVFLKKNPAHWVFLKNGFFSKRPWLFKNFTLVDLADVLLRFEEFKNMPDKWVLEIYE